MGSLIKPPKPAAPPPMVKTTPEKDMEEDRLEALKRRRRGRAGTIKTGYRGVLSETLADQSLANKQANTQANDKLGG